jgi:thymidylate synthase
MVFSYTYSERLRDARVENILKDMKEHPHSRQIYISIWNPLFDGPRLGKRRVPCSLGYQLMRRKGQLDIAYHMRSSDFTTHFDNDVWLALKLLEWFCEELELPMGSFTHKIGSLHVYEQDVVHAF